ncbi:MAG: transporter [Rhodothermales bacterium]|nr:transporter [Rhodothermales bacterium]MBO6779925.1 transporter [Rhodothermales bacterium]
MRFPLCALILALLVLPASGQTISTDRPDFGASTSVLPMRTVQLEAGVKRTRIDDSNADQVLESLLRFGIASPIELRLGWTGINRFTDANGTSTSGSGDISVGAKAVLSEGGRRAPSSALILTMSLPSGADAFSAGETVPEARLALGWSLAGQLGLTLNAGSYWTPAPPGLFGDDDGRDRNDFYSVTLGRSTDRGHTVYGEVFGLLLPDDVEDAHHFGVGYAFLLRDTAQLDVYIGSGLGGSAPDAFIGAGFAVRLPE